MAKRSGEMENLVIAGLLSSFYKGKKVFVTGHTGFKGSWLMCVLAHFGAETKGYALAPEYKGGLFNYYSSAYPGKSIIADIRNRQQLQQEINSFAPDIIFHLAAQPLVRRSYQLPAETFEINVGGTANLLEATIPLKGKCSVIVITTDKVYQNREEEVWYNEDDILGGHDPYSASKACCELVCDSFRKSFFNTEHYPDHQKSLATVRAGNVIGGGDWSMDRLIPDIVHSIFSDTEIQVRNPNAIRPWQHVLEAISGYLVLGLKMQNEPVRYSTAFNFGPLPDDHLTVQEVVKSAIKILGKGSWKNISQPGQLHEATLLKLDISRASRELDWKPKLNAMKAIDWTMQWYKVSEAQKMEFTNQQIEDYFSL